MRDGSRLGGGRYIRRSSSSERPGSGEYKVVLVIAPIGIAIGMYLILMGIGHTKEHIQELQM